MWSLRPDKLFLAIGLGYALGLGAGCRRESPPPPAAQMAATAAVHVTPPVSEAPTVANLPPSHPSAPVDVMDNGSIVIDLTLSSTIEPPFVVTNDLTAAAGRALTVPPRAGNKQGRAALAFQLDRGGSYDVWIRAYWGTDGEDACSNSIQLELDGHRPVLVTDSTYRQWHWVKARPGGALKTGFKLAPGAHTLRLTNREDGIKLDQALLTPWHADEFMRYIPDGIEP